MGEGGATITVTPPSFTYTKQINGFDISLAFLRCFVLRVIQRLGL